MLTVVGATFVAVLVAEILGDKLVYTTGILATRYKPLPVLVGIALAFMAKMGAAVVFGGAISRLPRGLIAAATFMNISWVALVVWRSPDIELESEYSHASSRAALVSFASVFFSEWADLGQITAATMAARFGMPVAVWLGAVCAMLVKGVAAAFAGASLRRWLSARLSSQSVRFASVAVLMMIGALTALKTLVEGR